MNEMKQPTQNREEGVTRTAFWGTIALAGIDVSICSYLFVALYQQPRTPIMYTVMAVFLLAILTALTSFVLTLSRRQELAAKLLFCVIFVIGISAVTLFQGRTLDASLSILFIAVMVIHWLFPSHTNRSPYYAFSVAAFVLMWVIEWINPSWRIQFEAPTLGPAAVGIFALILGILVFLQVRTVIASRFLSLSLRAKLLTSIISITTLSLLVYGAIFYYRTQQSQTFWSNTLQTTVQQQSQQQITDSTQFQAHTADQVLSEVTLAVQQLADYRTSLFASISILGQGGYWDANSRLQKRADGQYVNAISEPASVFIPNTETLSPSFITDLNDSVYLDFSAPSVLKQNPNIVALYYVSEENYTVYYPNIDLASAVPADFDARAQAFYLVGTPQNDPDRKPVWTKPYQDPAGTGLIVTASVPVYDNYDQFRGVMSADVQLSRISEEISAIKAGKTGFAFLIDPDGHIIAMPEAGYSLFGIFEELVPVNESPKTTILGLGSSELQDITQKMVNGKSGLATVTIKDTQYYVSYAPLPVIGYSLGLIAPISELDATYLAARETIQQETRTTTGLSILILLVVLMVASSISLILGRFLSTPLTRLTETAAEVAKGNLHAKADVRTNDEIGLLASTFNTMTSRLQEILGSLEQRVADRTRNLELAAEVGRAVSEVRDLDVMLKDACDLILKEFGLYYVQVYLTDPIRATLKLEAGTGNVGEQLVGRGHSLPLDISSINGRAAMEKHSVVISDTTKSPTFRQNPLLPETRGEMAVPLIVANKVVGVLDMQSSQPGMLTEEILPAFEALAGQLAVAIQNSNLLAEAEEARAELEKHARRLVRQTWNEHLDAIHKPEELGYVFDRKEIVPLSDAEEIQSAGNNNAISSSISVTGETLGSLVVEMDDTSRNEQAAELVMVVARQVAQQIENLRLLESAERYRSEAERAARLQTIEGWQKYIESRPADGLAYFYDTKEVQSHGADEDASIYSQPLKARDETIGKLSVQGLTDEDQESVELVSAVAERLGAHIENLRLFEQTRQGQVELDKRARQLAAVAEVSAVSSRELEIQKMLESVVFLTQRKFGLYHAHVFLYNEQTNVLKIAACGWKEGDEHEGTHGTAAIPFDQEQSLVARAARSRKAVIVNDVHNEPGWLPNPLLPDTASELAVPLLIGDRVLGVLDVQADHINAFTEEDANIQTTLASQVATALQNAHSFDQAQKQAKREAMLNVINQKIQNATSVEAVLQIAARELGHALGAPMTIAQLSMKDKPA